MTLRILNEKQRDFVSDVLSRYNVLVLEINDGTVHVDDFVPYDAMAEIVDHLRTAAPKKELFEQCWVAYRRKGIKKKALEYWKKLSDTEKDNVLPHVKAYVSSRDVQFQKDFERYLRDKVFMTVVYNGSNIVYDPSKLERGETSGNVYTPSGNFNIVWNDSIKGYMYIGYYCDRMSIADGYDDDNRPNGARLILNNARGIIQWSSDAREWRKL